MSRPKTEKEKRLGLSESSVELESDLRFSFVSAWKRKISKRYMYYLSLSGPKLPIRSTKTCVGVFMSDLQPRIIDIDESASALADLMW